MNHIAPTALDLALSAHDLTDSYEPTEQDLHTCLVCGADVTLDTYRDEDRHHGGYVHITEASCKCCDVRVVGDDDETDHALLRRAIRVVALESDRRLAAERAETVRPGAAA